METTLPTGRRAVPILAVALAVALSACGGAGSASGDVHPDTPPTTDVNLDDLPHAPIFVGRRELHMDGDIGRLGLAGDLPTPCHTPMWTVEHGAGRIDVEVWTVVEPDLVCSQVLQPFDIEISLGEITGAATVFLDGEEIGVLRR